MMAVEEKLAIHEQAVREEFDQRRHEVEHELEFILNLLDRVEDDTRRLWARMIRETGEARGLLSEN